MPEFVERQQPNSSESESLILGTIIKNNKKLWDVVGQLESDDFYIGTHKIVYEAILSLAEARSEITPALLADIIKTRGKLEQIGGLTFITRLSQGVPSQTNLVPYIEIVKTKSVARQKIRLAGKINSSLFENDSDSVAEAEKQLYDLNNQSQIEGFSTPADLTDSILRSIHKTSKNPSRITGLETGFDRLDLITTGLQPEDLVIIAARPSMGKSALCMTLAQNAAVHNNNSIAVFSLEMSKTSLYRRMLAAEARVDANKIRNGYLSIHEWARLLAASKIIDKAPIYIDSTGGITTMELRAKVTKLSMKGVKLDMIIVDYIQLMNGTKKSNNRQEEVSSISRDLKAIAKEMQLPVVALSQLSRAPENRTDHRPHLADLRESGAIEQDADIVAFIYREEQYNRTPENEGMAELIVAKQRNGPTETIRLAFIKELTKFENLWEVTA